MKGDSNKRDDMKLTDFNYKLPEELIAQVPIEHRDESRLMVLNREKQTIEDKIFKDIIDYLEPGDCLVRNNTKFYQQDYMEKKKQEHMLNSYY